MANFIDNFRKSQFIPKAPAFIYPNKIEPNTVQENIDNARNSGRKAINGILFIDDSYMDNNPTTMEMDKRFDVMSKEVFENYGTLNKVLDNYDKAPTVKDKYRVIADAWDRLDVSSWKNPTWFLFLKNWTDMAEYTGDDYKNVSDTLRMINEHTRKNFYNFS